MSQDSQKPQYQDPDLTPQDKPPTNRFCMECGAPLMPGARFCSTCGKAYRDAAHLGFATPAPEPREYDDRLPRYLEAIVVIGMGVIFLFLTPNFLMWSMSQMFGTPFNPGVTKTVNDVPIPYPQWRPQFPYDIGMTALCTVFILHGIMVSLLPYRWPARVMLVLTGAMMLYNLWWMFTSFSLYGFAPMLAIGMLGSIFLLFSQAQFALFRRAY